MQIRCRNKAYYALLELQKKERRTLLEVVSTIILEAAEKSGVDIAKLKEL